MTGYSLIAQYQPRNRGNQKDHQRDNQKRINPRPTPELFQPFIKQGEFHYLLIYEGIKAHLSYKWLDEQWTVRFSWLEDGEETQAGFYPEIQAAQYPRDMPATDMLQAIIEVIDNRWSDDDNDWIPF